MLSQRAIKLYTTLFFLASAWMPCGAQTLRQLKNMLSDNGLPGLQLSYTVNGKTTALNVGVGVEGSSDPTVAGTIFRAGSLGKSVFAYAVMRLYDKGLISLDTPLMAYIGAYDRFDTTDPRFAKISARMVLSHSSGLAEFSQFDTHAPVKLLFEPGTSFSYSGEGIWFLQKAVEKIMKMPFEQLMQQEVFIPLEMSNSTYTETDKPDSTMLGAEDKELKWMTPNAAFTLLTTAHDYNLFLQALINGKGLKPATKQRMFARQSNARWYQRDTVKADEYIDWGLGVGLQQNEKGKAIWHWGSTGDFYSFYIAYPATKESLVFFTRGDRSLKIADAIINRFMGRQTTWAMRWLQLGYDNPETMTKLFNSLRQQGIAAAPAIFNKLKSAGSQFSERDINNYGKTLLKQGRNKQALAIFKQQAAWYPQSPIAYDGIAAAAEACGDMKSAMASYRRSLELDPGNPGAGYHIKALENASRFMPGQLKDFEGRFKNGGNGMWLQITAMGNKLMITQSWDGGKLEFFRVEGLQFYNNEPGFTLKFTRDAAGKIEKAFVNDTPVAWQRE
ncbi:serine hydrolase domain-containing protein [Mucilaginibacter psychrotolerans]|uniref:Serine hydrolase n=1 Tax=Mucilaginibacter psychrotolerans TaxID=1524096 RepID=A0A4Y8S4D5_9SPHI|nr:serine hydrolase [Mucilaginibacter psychrotolerans]TFF33803.1 serine hydrolase [Mucilaginibacter psychrotolerans]